MISRTELTLKHRLTLIGVLVALLPFPFLALVSRRAALPLPPPSHPGLTSSDLDHLADSAYQAAVFSRQELANTLSIAGRMLAGDRGVRQLKARQVTWPVTGSRPVKLPLLSIRKTLLLPAANPRHGFVSEFSSLSGAQCSVFQRMNSAGDMLWVATSLPPSARLQSLGTVIPAISPEAKEILEKRSYIGPVALAGDRMLAGFEPITRADGVVIGMLAATLPESAEAVRIHQALSRMPAGSRGELFAGGSDLPIPPSALPGILRAARSQPVKPVEVRYRLPAKGDVLTHVRYFAPWDWLVGVTVPQSEMAVIPAPVAAPVVDHTVPGMGVVFFLTLAISAAVWWRYSGRLAAPVLSAQEKIGHHVDRLLRLAGKASQPPSSGREPASLERASTSISEVSRTANLMLTGVGETMLSTRGCQGHAAKASVELAAMQTTIAELTASNSQVSGLVKDIAAIALQSRLLALNASIEAARAGHHGASFSVVADEFGNLAQRCSENARNTTALLTNSVTLGTAGTEHLVRLGAEVEEFSRRSETAAQSLARVLEASNQQARTIAGLERSLQRSVCNEDDTPMRLELEIRAEAASLRQTAAEIVAHLAGPKEMPKAKRLGPKSQSSAAKAPANTRSARRAC